MSYWNTSLPHKQATRCSQAHKPSECEGGWEWLTLPSGRGEKKNKQKKHIQQLSVAKRLSLNKNALIVLHYLINFYNLLIAVLGYVDKTNQIELAKIQL